MIGQSKKGRRRRSRFHPSHYKHGPVYTDAAYDELSRRTFACWIRMMTFDNDTLRSGITTIARELRLTRKACRDVLKELELAGYVSFAKEGSATTVVLLRKAMVDIRGTNWIRA